MNNVTMLVVGSGPAGVSVSTALLANGHDVTMVDAGLGLEPDREAFVERLRTSEPDAWDPKDTVRLKGRTNATFKGLPRKKIYGSTFPYDAVQGIWPVETRDVGCVGSFGRGGFSNVWGAAILPFAREDIADWPIDAAELSAGYREVSKLFTVVGESNDDLAGLFPIEAPMAPLRRSEQAEGVYARLKQNRTSLQAKGLAFGGARLAFNPLAAKDCRHCGMCMYGCPYDLIYSSQNTLKALSARPGFKYVGGVVIDRFKETGGRVDVQGRRIETGEAVSFSTQRLFLAAGALHTTRMLVRSLGAQGRAFTFRDSQYFLLPCLTHFGTKGVDREHLHTLSQLFLELRDPRVSAHTVHFQVYTYNDIYMDVFKSALGPMFPLARPVLRRALERTVLLLGYLHSHESSSIEGTLSEESGIETMKLRLKHNPSLGGSRTRILRKLRSIVPATGLRPLAPFWKWFSVGGGFHHGCSFPMKTCRSEFSSDTLGRPHPFENVHAVDATVLPSIPATTITFSVMANAFRIGSMIA